jgi:hypothetical protein
MSRDIEQRIGALAIEAYEAGDAVGAGVCLRALGYRIVAEPAEARWTIGRFRLGPQDVTAIRTAAPNKAAALKAATAMLKAGEA